MNTKKYKAYVIGNEIIIEDNVYVISKPINSKTMGNCNGCMLSNDCDRVPEELSGCIDANGEDVIFIEKGQEKQNMLRLLDEEHDYLISRLDKIEKEYERIENEIENEKTNI